MRTAIMVGILGAVSLAVAGCKGAEPGSSGGTTITAPPGAETSVSHAETATPPPAPAPASEWLMPNLVGSNLQAAQDKIQAITGNPVFITLSHDATGQGRNQVLDSNWKVCSQNVVPGEPFSDTTKIDFGAVKLTEKCP